MEFGTRVLRTGLMENLKDVERQISEVHRQAEELHTEPSRIRDSMGHFILTPLLVAKAQTLHALVLLQTNKEK